MESRITEDRKDCLGRKKVFWRPGYMDEVKGAKKPDVC